ncbi:unnamed protein product [Amoebophrya sp. A120]|nr:unnamed protein product [Amoebophrya sp. A120]|eukprot:GSA120T00012470001.1
MTIQQQKMKKEEQHGMGMAADKNENTGKNENRTEHAETFLSSSTTSDDHNPSAPPGHTCAKKRWDSCTEERCCDAEPAGTSVAEGSKNLCYKKDLWYSQCLGEGECDTQGGSWYCIVMNANPPDIQQLTDTCSYEGAYGIARKTWDTATRTDVTIPMVCDSGATVGGEAVAPQSPTQESPSVVAAHSSSGAPSAVGASSGMLGTSVANLDERTVAEDAAEGAVGSCCTSSGEEAGATEAAGQEDGEQTGANGSGSGAPVAEDERPVCYFPDFTVDPKEPEMVPIHAKDLTEGLQCWLWDWDQGVWGDHAHRWDGTYLVNVQTGAKVAVAQEEAPEPTTAGSTGGSSTPAPSPNSSGGGTSTTNPDPLSTPTPGPTPPSGTASPGPLPPTPAPAGSQFLSTTTAGHTNARRKEWLGAMTQVTPGVQYFDTTVDARVVVSSGGAARGVVSEGQGYGLWIGGTTVAAMRVAYGWRKGSDPQYDEAVQETLETWYGWRQACYISTECKEDFAIKYHAGRNDVMAAYFCGPDCPFQGMDKVYMHELREAERVCHPCLPHWKVKPDLTEHLSGGCNSASDGDIDGIAGMILLVLTTAADRDDYLWWGNLAKESYQSCKDVMVHLVDKGKGVNEDQYLFTVGTSWGGFGVSDTHPRKGQNPSYHGPAVWRLCRDYMDAFESVVGAPPGDRFERPPSGYHTEWPPPDSFAGASPGEPPFVSHADGEWEKLLRGTYNMLKDNQCPQTGWISNWYNTNEKGADATQRVGDRRYGRLELAGSGTPKEEFGSEGSRGVWRVLTDRVWYAHEPPIEGVADFNSQKFLDRIVLQMDKAWTGETVAGND